jgi:hypothetical protein
MAFGATRPDEPEFTGPSPDVLFDSRRHWLEQLDVFKERQNGASFPHHPDPTTHAVQASAYYGHSSGGVA